MTTTAKFKLVRRAQGTNHIFALSGKEIVCDIENRAGLGSFYLYETDDPADDRRLQIVHGFKVEIPGPVNADRAQIASLGESVSKQASVQRSEEEAEKPKKPARKRRTRKKSE